MFHRSWLILSTLLTHSVTALAADNRPVTFAEDVAAIVYAKCSGCHHPGQAGPFSLLTYDDVSKRADTIEAVVSEGFMPPWPPSDAGLLFSHDRRLTEFEKQTLLAWIKADAPEGDPARTPPQPVYPDGWALGQPDLVVTMDGEFQVPADGPDLYRNFVIPVNLPDDRWIKAIELRPRARSVVHHALYFAGESDLARRRDADDDGPGFSGMGFAVRERLGGYVPGAVPERLPEDLALPLPAGTDLVLQTHFHPSGKPEVEQLTVGLYFAEEAPSRELVAVQIPPAFGRGAGIDIPAGDANYAITDEYELPTDVTAYLVSGHAHYICKAMEMVAALPDGTTRVLLDINDWNLDWQGQYQFAQPVDLPAGTTITTTLVYDNSADNIRNPFSPPQRVKWGRESTDEMGSITLSVVAAPTGDAARLKRNYLLKNLEVLGNAAGGSDGQSVLRDQIRERLGRLDQGLFDRLDSDGDDVVSASELPPRAQAWAVDLFDIDEDGGVSREEWEAANRDAPGTDANSNRDRGLRGALEERLRKSGSARLFEELDADGDGHLRDAEVPQRFRGNALGRFDEDGDGAVSREEWEKGVSDLRR
jgi:hypothetical protein